MIFGWETDTWQNVMILILLVNQIIDGWHS